MASYDIEHNIPSDPSNNNSSSAQQQQHHRPDLTDFLTTLAHLDLGADNTNTDTDTFSTFTAPPSSSDQQAPPTTLSQAFRALASAFAQTRTSATTNRDDDPRGGGRGGAEGEETPLDLMISSLLASAAHPPTKPQGVPQSFLDELDRVRSKGALARAGECPICGNVFVEDEYPLVVRLPCWDPRKEEKKDPKKDPKKGSKGASSSSKVKGQKTTASAGQGDEAGGGMQEGHVFDLECIAAWLKLNRTCPIDRVNLIERQEQQRRQRLRDAGVVVEKEKEDRRGEREKGEKATQGKGGEEEEEWDGMFA